MTGSNNQHESSASAFTHIHVDDGLVYTIDNGKQGVDATGVERQQRRRVARVRASVPGVVPCCCQSACTDMHSLLLCCHPSMLLQGDIESPWGMPIAQLGSQSLQPLQ